MEKMLSTSTSWPGLRSVSNESCDGSLGLSQTSGLLYSYVLTKIYHIN